MSDVPQGPGWWQASDDKWYPPESHPDAQARPGGAPGSFGDGPGMYGGGQPGAFPGPQMGGSGSYGVPFNATPGNEQLAVVSLVLGVVSVPLACCCYIGLLTGIAAAVTGFMARKKIDESQGMLEGDGMALAGIVLGIIVVVLSLGLIIASVAFDTATFNSGLR